MFNNNDEKFKQHHHQQMYNLLSTIYSTLFLIIIINTHFVNGVLCPNGCNCENEILKANCSGAGLEVVPIQLNPELEMMDLSKNKIKKLFFMFNCYEKLLNLDVSANRIETIENGDFKTQKYLKYLNLSNNHLISIEKATFEGLISLIHLDLSKNKLKSFNTNAFHDLNHLNVLLLNDNNLDYFNENTFKPITNLKLLNLNDNSFLDIPIILSELTKLKTLLIARNLIEIIEDNKMPNLYNLNKLDLQENLIIDIEPSGFINLPNLDHLDLSDNNLTMIPTIPLSKLPQLVNLKLSGNSFNRITSVAFRGLFNIKYLSLNRLELLEIIDSRAFVDNIHLEKISLDYNYKIKKLPTRLFNGNPKIKYISIRYNSLEYLVANHFPLDQLIELKLGGNPFDCNCSMGWLWMTLQECRIKYINQSNLELLTTTTTTTTTTTVPTTATVQTATVTATATAATAATIPALPASASLQFYNNLMLDFNDITCNMPEELHNKQLINASQRQMDCSMSWLAITSVILTILFILSIITGVLVFMPRKRHKHNNINGKHLPVAKQTSKLLNNGIQQQQLVTQQLATQPSATQSPPPPPPLPPPRKCSTNHLYHHHERHLSNERYVIPPVMIHGTNLPPGTLPTAPTSTIPSTNSLLWNQHNNYTIGNNIYEQLHDHHHNHQHHHHHHFRDRPHIAYV